MYRDLRYIAMELMTTCTFVGFLIVISFIDLEFTIIPDKVVYPGLLVGLLLAMSAAMLQKDAWVIISKGLGAVAGAGVIALIAVVGSAIFRKEAMGCGDIKLMAMIGIYLGLWPHIPLTLIGAAFFGSFLGLILVLARRKRMDSAIPFGPFLSVSALVSLLFGKEIWIWYQHLIGLG